MMLTVSSKQYYVTSESGSVTLWHRIVAIPRDRSVRYHGTHINVWRIALVGLRTSL